MNPIPSLSSPSRRRLTAAWAASTALAALLVSGLAALAMALEPAGDSLGDAETAVLVMLPPVPAVDAVAEPRPDAAVEPPSAAAGPPASEDPPAAPALTEAPEVPDTATGNRLSHEIRGSVGVTHEAGFADLQVKSGLRREMFEDVDLSGGGKEDNSDRNYTELALSLRGTFNRGAVIRPFAEVAYTPRFHDKNVDRNGLRRDSHGLSGTLGLRIDDDPVWTGEVGVTYLVRDYEDPTLKTVDAPGVLANLQWRPTELTQIDLSATLTAGETASAVDSATLTWGAGATLRHALRDNLDLIGAVTFSSAKTTAGTDESYGTRAGLEWKLNPLASWSMFYEGNWYDSAAAGSDYDEHRLLGSIILKR